MADDRLPLQLVLLWHFHQPEYKHVSTGGPALPWTRLHALKDYADMAELLSRHPGVRATVDVSPCLIEQLAAFADGTALPDPFLEVARRRTDDLTAEQRRFVVSFFLQFRRDTLARGLPRVTELAALRGEHGPGGVPQSVADRFDTQAIRDVVVLHHLAWCGPLLSSDPVVRALREVGRGFTEEDKSTLLDLQDAFLRGVLDRWARLAASGHVEFSVSPYFHPVLPLLADSRSVLEARPSARLPAEHVELPNDARLQLSAALTKFEQTFGRPAGGGWSPECAVSSASLRILGAAGYRWTVSDEEVLLASLGERPGRAGRRAAALYRPWRVDGGPVVLFRDRELSGLLDAGYAAWSARIAADDFLRRLRRIRSEWPVGAPPAVVTVALDGENPWERYSDGAREILEALYSALDGESRIATVHASEAAQVDRADLLPRLTAGSWFDAALDTWIGDRDDNRAWDLLMQTRRAVASTRPHADLADPAWRAVLAAEGSDWFRWLGRAGGSPFLAELDACFRELLRSAWASAGLVPPAALGEPIRRYADPAGRRPAGEIRPQLDGRVSDYYEWLAAARIPAAEGPTGAVRNVVRELWFGSDGEVLYLRLDPGEPPASAILGGALLRLQFPGYPDRQLSVLVPEAGAAESAGVRMAVDRILEIAVPLAAIPGDGEAFRFAVEVETGEGRRQLLPESGSLTLPAPEKRPHEWDWFV